MSARALIGLVLMATIMLAVEQAKGADRDAKTPERLDLDAPRVAIVLDPPNAVERYLARRLVAETSCMRVTETAGGESSLATYLLLGFRVTRPVGAPKSGLFATLRYEPIETIERRPDEVRAGHGDGVYLGAQATYALGDEFLVAGELEGGRVISSGTEHLSGFAGGVGGWLGYRLSERVVFGLRAGYRGGAYRYYHVGLPVRLAF